MTTTMPAFPLRRVGSDFALVQGGDLIEQAIRQLVLTEPGELPWRPRFGTGLASLVHDNNDVVTAQIARVRVADALRLWLPRGARVTDVTTRRDGNTLLMRIGYELDGAAGIATVDLGGGGGVT